MDFKSIEDLARERGVTVDELIQAYEAAQGSGSRIPVHPLPWWGPTPEEQKLLDEGELDPQHFSRETTHERWEFIPLRDLEGEVMPFLYRRAISAGIARGEERTERTKQLIAERVARWTDIKKQLASRRG